MISADINDERHQALRESSLAILDNQTISNIISSIISSGQDSQEIGNSTQYLFPVDLLVSVDNKSKNHTVQAALPSSFAWHMPLKTASPCLPSSEVVSTEMMGCGLNPTAPSFEPCCTTNDTVGEDDLWCNLDQENYQDMSPTPRRPLRKPQYKLMAAFVRHVTLPIRQVYPANTVLIKTWALKNTGNVPWGYGVRLVYCKGDAGISLCDSYPVPNAQPGQVVEVSATIRSGTTAGRYCTYYRLKTEKAFFGPRVWSDIIVGPTASLPCPEKNAKWKKRPEHCKILNK